MVYLTWKDLRKVSLKRAQGKQLDKFPKIIYQVPEQKAIPYTKYQSKNNHSGTAQD
jgi:hypothetical protein